MWTTQVRSLMGARPEEPKFLKGGRGVIGTNCSLAAAKFSSDRKRKTIQKILDMLDKDGGYMTSAEIADRLGVCHDYATRTCKRMAKEGLLKARQDSLDVRRTWHWATK